MKLETLLPNLGFSEKEVKIYVAMLEVGSGTAQKIARTASLPRTTTYSVLEKLVERGIVGKTLRKGTLNFVAEPPSRLASLVRSFERELDGMLPELEALYNKSEGKPKIIFYEGKEAIQKVYDDTLREKPSEILEWNTDEFF
jgi:sugar-specific transcriptional regulator TrmB